MIDVITGTVFKTELKNLLQTETDINALMVHAICLLAKEVLEGDMFYCCIHSGQPLEENSNGTI